MHTHTDHALVMMSYHAITCSLLSLFLRSDFKSFASKIYLPHPFLPGHHPFSFLPQEIFCLNVMAKLLSLRLTQQRFSLYAYHDIRIVDISRRTPDWLAVSFWHTGESTNCLGEGMAEPGSGVKGEISLEFLHSRKRTKSKSSPPQCAVDLYLTLSRGQLKRFLYVGFWQ